MEQGETIQLQPFKNEVWSLSKTNDS